jgi:hypothetical protein
VRSADIAKWILYAEATPTYLDVEVLEMCLIVSEYGGEVHVRVLTDVLANPPTHALVKAAQLLQVLCRVGNLEPKPGGVCGSSTQFDGSRCGSTEWSDRAGRCQGNTGCGRGIGWPGSSTQLAPKTEWEGGTGP